MKSELEKVPHACEGEVPQTHRERGEKLMTDSGSRKRKSEILCVCVCVHVLIEKKD